MNMHIHIPVRIVIDEEGFYEGLGQCYCRIVARLRRWAHRPWLRQTDPELSHGLF